MLSQVIAPIIIISDMDEAVLLHGIKNLVKIFPSTRHIFQQNSVLDGFALRNGIAYGIGAEKPLLNAVPLQIINVLDIVAVWRSLFAFNP